MAKEARKTIFHGVMASDDYAQITLNYYIIY